MSEWVEIRSDFSPADLQRVPRIVDAAVAVGAVVHAFFYEPWSPVVIRARGTANALTALRERLAVWDNPPQVVAWTPIEDREHFGSETYDRAIEPFFEASTRVAYETSMLTTSDSRLSRESLNRKLVHCYLNAQGLDTPDEVRFAKNFLSNRRKQARRDYGRFWRWRKRK